MNLPSPPPSLAPTGAAAQVTSEWIEGLGQDSVNGQRGVLLRNVLSKQECEFFIRQAEDLGLDSVGKAGYDVSYRNNDRVIATSEDVANMLLDRISPFIQQEMRIGAENTHLHHSGTYGEWELCGMNECFRLCRYQPGGHFSPHYDARFQRNMRELSLKTVMIYLNDDFQGGTTNFIKEEYAQRAGSAGGEDPPNAPDDMVFARIKPEAGMAIVFDHLIYHEGAKVEGGKKYILRTDAMYRRL